MSLAASTLKPVAAAWLALQCQMLPSLIRGAVFLGRNEAAMQTPVACWPQETDNLAGLTSATRLALEKQSPVVCGAARGSSSLNIASPLLVNGTYVGIVAVEVDSPNEQQQRGIIQLLQWGSACFEFLVKRESSAGSSSLATVVRIVATALEQDHFLSAATATATELAACLGSDRVSIGFKDQRQTHVKAISHSVKFSKKANLIKSICMCMDEALDQQSTVVYPPVEEGSIILSCAHEELSTHHGKAAVCTVPLGNNGRLYGAITFERGDPAAFDAGEVERAEVIASLLGPILRDDGAARTN